MDARRRAYFEALDIQPYQRRGVAAADQGTELKQTRVPDEFQAPVKAPARAPAGKPQTIRPPAEEIALMDWATLRQTVAGCTACDLYKTRTQTVFGVGNENADWMFIGEAPGADEDRKGEPFVGRAGQLLNSMIQALGFKREQVYIANILRCRPPGNRDPLPEEAECCSPFLQRQIALVKPKIIIVVGRIAAQNLLYSQEAIGKMRSRVYEYGPDRIPVVVTYHPAYLLRSPNEKRKSWMDLKFAREAFNTAIKRGHA